MTARLQADPAVFRRALGAFATGVTIVTTRGTAGEDVGITANSFNSVSLDPPLVLWSLARKANSLVAFQKHGFFAVHVLAADQEGLSQRFATPGADKFAGLSLSRGIGELPLLDGCAARFQCRTAFAHDGGDHVIFVGEVLSFDTSTRSPLLFHAGRYALALEKPREEIEAAGAEPDSSFSRDFLIYLLGQAHFHLWARLRPELEQHGLSETEWFVLSLLGVSDHRSIAELDRLLWHTGARVTFERIARLAAGGFVTLQGGYDPGARVSLTATGRDVVIRFVAAAKAVEAHAARTLREGELQAFKGVLRRLGRDSDPGPAPLLPGPDVDGTSL